MINEKYKVYCYSIRKEDGTKLVGGNIHAESMDDAAERVSRLKDLQIGFGSLDSSYFLRDEKRVSVFLHVHPEYTARGQEALKAWRLEKAEKGRLERIQAEKEDLDKELFLEEVDKMGGIEEVRKLLKGLGHE